MDFSLQEEFDGRRKRLTAAYEVAHAGEVLAQEDAIKTEKLSLSKKKYILEDCEREAIVEGDTHSVLEVSC